jgi:small subunit ribosomal protein S19e
MTTVYDVDAGALVKATAEDLKTKVKAPVWAPIVKTGVAKDRPPEDPNWWYVREASILRKIYVKGPIGVSRLRKEYCSKKNCGVRPEKSLPASGKVTRLAVQQLEGLGFVKKTKAGDGREITPAGVKYLDNLAHKVKAA